MNKNLIIGLVAGVVVVGAGVAYFATSGSKDDTNANTTNTETANTQQSESSNQSTFSPANTMDKDYVATFATQTEQGEFNATINYDKDSKSWQYVSTAEDQDIELIVNADAYYSKINGEWIKLPTSGDAASGFDSKSYELTDEELKAFQEKATYKGEAGCPAGSCDLWTVENYEGNDKLSFYVDKETNTVNQLTTENGGKTSTITYTYQDVTVEVPTDAKELPSIGQ